MLKTCQPVPCYSHPYLDRKQIQSHGVHYLPNYQDFFTNQHGKSPLILSVMRGKTLCGFQLIYSSGFKRFIANTIKRGSYYLVSRLTTKQINQADSVVLCEGFATACSIIENRYPSAIAYIAFDASNLPLVAAYLRQKYPYKKIIICADNDWYLEQKTGRNIGVEYAKKAVLCSQGIGNFKSYVDIPPFEPATAKHYSDWNDYYTLPFNS